MSELGVVTPCWTIEFERRSRHPASRVWKAITDPEQLGRWMRYPATVDLRVGGSWFLDFSPEAPLDGVIVRMEPERNLACVWGRSVLEWTLRPEDDGCTFWFVHHGQALRLTPEEEGLASGWHSFVDGLEAHLDGRRLTDGEDRALHRDRMPAYRERILAALPSGALG